MAEMQLLIDLSKQNLLSLHAVCIHMYATMLPFVSI